MRREKSRAFAGYDRAMRKTACAVLLLGGCSFGMKTLDPEWNGSKKPDCDASYGPMLVDALLTAGFAAGSTIAAESGNEELAFGAAIVALGFAIGGYVGESNADECSSAIAHHVVGTQIAKAQIAEERRVDRAAEPVKAPAPKLEPRGFYCTASSATTAGSCARAKADCERARDILASAADDLSACTLVETAQCFAASSMQRCFPSAESCASAQAKVSESSKAGVSGTCSETR